MIMSDSTDSFWYNLDSTTGTFSNGTAQFAIGHCLRHHFIFPRALYLLNLKSFHCHTQP